MDTSNTFLIANLTKCKAIAAEIERHRVEASRMAKWINAVAWKLVKQ